MAEPLDCFLKVRVTETVHDDFMIAGRMLGFATRSDFLNWVINKELYGIVTHLNITRGHDTKEPGAFIGRKKE
jgi:hypothetical protein